MSKIKLVIFDLDETLWRMEDGYCSILRPPLRETAPDTLTDSIGRTIKLVGGVRELLASLSEAGIILSVASKNDPEPTTEVMHRFKIYDYFKYPQMEWNSKGKLVTRIIDLLLENDGISIKPEEALLVDDWESNVNDVRNLGVRTLHFSTDISRIEEIKGLVLEDDL